MGRHRRFREEGKSSDSQWPAQVLQQIYGIRWGWIQRCEIRFEESIEDGLTETKRLED